MIAADTPAKATGGLYLPLLRAMSQTGLASLASGIFSAVAAKIMATLGGPAAVATLTTLQQLRQAAVVGATGNGMTALVRGTCARSGVEKTEYVRTVGWVFAAATGLVAAGMVAWPRPLGAFAGLGPAAIRLVPWLAIPVVLSNVLVYLSALLNSLGATGRLAALSISGSAAMALGAGLAASFVSRGRSEALVALLIFSAAVSVVGALMAVAHFRDPLKVWFQGPGRWWSVPAARGFLGMSAAMMASGLAASGALLLVRGRIAATQGLTVTGEFDAAWGLSMNQVTLVLSSLQTYYLPMVARSRSRAERDAHISSVLTVTVAAAAGAIAAIALLKPLLLTLLYSGAFRPAAGYLRWTLLGDYLKVTSWILSIPIFAAADMRAFLAIDLVAYGVFVATATGLALLLTAATGAAVAFVAMYAAHLLLCAIYLWRKLHFIPAPSAVAAWAAGLCLVTTVSALTWRQM